MPSGSLTIGNTITAANTGADARGTFTSQGYNLIGVVSLGCVVEGDFTGDGPVDAIFRAINAATRRDARLREFRIDAVTGGQDALGEASVVLELAGQSASGQGVSTDIIEAAAQAYVRALSNAERKVLAIQEQPDLPEAELTPTP